MNKREQMLALVLAAIFVLGGGFLTYRWLRSMSDSRVLRETVLHKEIARKSKAVQFSKPLTDRMHLYEQRSLPSDKQAAGTLYQQWLLENVTEVELDEASVNAVTSRGKEGVYHEFAFNVTGRGDLRQLVQYLHTFYSVDYLHRIKRLHLRRIPDSRRLDLALAVEALSVPTSAAEKELSQNPGHRLKQEDLTAYMSRITSRNLSGPANRDPEFASTEVPTAYLGKPFRFTVRAKDPDRWDSLQFTLDAPALSGATLDAKRGDLEWTPTELGSFEWTVTIADDGLPPKSATKTFTVEVQQAPTTMVSKPTSFESGQNAYLTAITQVEDRRQAWINLRKDNKLLKLVEGTEFQVGDVHLAVLEIHDKAVEVESQTLSMRWKVGLGQNLEVSMQLADEMKSKPTEHKPGEPKSGEPKPAEAKPEEPKPEVVEAHAEPVEPVVMPTEVQPLPVGPMPVPLTNPPGSETEPPDERR